MGLMPKRSALGIDPGALGPVRLLPPPGQSRGTGGRGATGPPLLSHLDNGDSYRNRPRRWKNSRSPNSRSGLRTGCFDRGDTGQTHPAPAGLLLPTPCILYSGADIVSSICLTCRGPRSGHRFRVAELNWIPSVFENGGSLKMFQYGVRKFPRSAPRFEFHTVTDMPEG
jgi:hypothetical protein